LQLVIKFNYAGDAAQFFIKKIPDQSGIRREPIQVFSAFGQP
jgi:hypothetical protein